MFSKSLKDQNVLILNLHLIEKLYSFYHIQLKGGKLHFVNMLYTNSYFWFMVFLSHYVKYSIPLLLRFSIFLSSLYFIFVVFIYKWQASEFRIFESVMFNYLIVKMTPWIVTPISGKKWGSLDVYYGNRIRNKLLGMIWWLAVKCNANAINPGEFTKVCVLGYKRHQRINIF